MEVFGEGDCGCGVEGNWGLERERGMGGLH